MRFNLKKSLSLFVVLGALAGVGIMAVNLHGSHASGATVVVSAGDLAAAGFTQVKQIAPTAAGRFNGPNLYFSVADKVTSPASEAPNVVMISDLALPYQPGSNALYKYGADSHDFSITGGAGKEATLADGRIAINFSKGYNYVVVIGPNQTKIAALAGAIAAKIQ